MTDRPIIFSAPMVRAILEGRKTQTRRVTDLKGLRWAVGDRLWVRETWAVGNIYDGVAPRNINPGGKPGWCGVRYAATCDRSGIRDRPSIHMPRWVSRLTLLVTDVRVERLNDISERDAVREGLINNGDHTWPLWTAGEGFKEHLDFPIGAFQELWERINGEGSWEANPWVAAISFTVQHQNIDAPSEVAA